MNESGVISAFVRPPVAVSSKVKVSEVGAKEDARVVDIALGEIEAGTIFPSQTDDGVVNRQISRNQRAQAEVPPVRPLSVSWLVSPVSLRPFRWRQ